MHGTKLKIVVKGVEKHYIGKNIEKIIDDIQTYSTHLSAQHKITIYTNNNDIKVKILLKEFIDRYNIVNSVRCGPSVKLREMVLQCNEYENSEHKTETFKEWYGLFCMDMID